MVPALFDRDPPGPDRLRNGVIDHHPGIEENFTPWAGGFERINAYAFFAWLVVLAVTAVRRSLNEVAPGKGMTELAQTRGPSMAASG
jgi:hypothetical protein